VNVAIAVVTHQSARHLTACLDSVAGGEVIVVDNASTDGSAELARSRGVRVIANETNVGYGAALDQAVRSTSAPWIVLANADVVFAPDAIARLIEFLEAHPRHALVGPRLIDPAGVVAASARGFPTLALEAAEAFRLRRFWPENPIHRAHWRPELSRGGAGDADWVVGACMAARRAALEEVGGVDGGYFLYYEEVDLAWRLSRRGWRIAYCPDALVTHVGGGSSAGREAELARAYDESRERFFLRAYGKAAVPALRLIRLAGTVLRTCVRAVSQPSE
jgi:N-acetylglucosaminyl-diphospho-decaprenol L-rhamnosyltransferase